MTEELWGDVQTSLIELTHLYSYKADYGNYGSFESSPPPEFVDKYRKSYENLQDFGQQIKSKFGEFDNQATLRQHEVVLIKGQLFAYRRR